MPLPTQQQQAEAPTTTDSPTQKGIYPSAGKISDITLNPELELKLLRNQYGDLKVEMQEMKELLRDIFLAKKEKEEEEETDIPVPQFQHGRKRPVDSPGNPFTSAAMYSHSAAQRAPQRGEPDASSRRPSSPTESLRSNSSISSSINTDKDLAKILLKSHPHFTGEGGPQNILGFLHKISRLKTKKGWGDDDVIDVVYACAEEGSKADIWLRNLDESGDRYRMNSDGEVESISWDEFQQMLKANFISSRNERNILRKLRELNLLRCKEFSS